MKRTLFTLGISALLLASPVVWSSEAVKLTSLEWPPYSGSDLPNQGASVAVAKAAFQAMGHTLEVSFYPWSRAVMSAEKQGQYVGYFPEYFYETTEFVFSDPMGKGPVGLVERVEKPIKWETVEDLKKYTLGIVQDYINTPELDALIEAGEVSVQSVTSDDQNILKVAMGRVDAAVIDPNVFSYLASKDPVVSGVRNEVKMNEKLLAEADLFVAFANTPTGKAWREIFNEGLSRIDVKQIMAENM